MEFGLLDFLIAYAIREMYNYTVDTSDTQMEIGTIYMEYVAFRLHRGVTDKFCM